ncbi:HGxxPAAW family protein [Actinomadura sp. HBU206391]|uniref:HGxxPAAW family protein n=1 Tax=Actinomadura sp. HBU206391 TaxID=2731692 RepID=UPI00164FB7D1|nr:HGxxPAAW family protein [Actinomadura sp. HBU206391]MBC6456785.1 hypothetical protein [Actinomadura sp. HBU206391]
MARGSHGGRPSSWIAVGVIILGFTIGGAGLTMGPSWPIFWVGVAVTVVGGLMALAADVFADVVLDETRVVPEIVDYSAIGGPGEQRRGGPYGETTDKPTRREPEEFPHG